MGVNDWVFYKTLNCTSVEDILIFSLMFFFIFWRVIVSCRFIDKFSFILVGFVVSVGFDSSTFLTFGSVFPLTFISPPMLNAFALFLSG
jgi:hypothetical protein